MQSRVVWRSLPALAVLVAVMKMSLLAGALQLTYVVLVRVMQILVLLAGSGSFWWFLRSYQLQLEQEQSDQLAKKLNYYQRYRARSSTTGGVGATAITSPRSSTGVLGAGFQLKAMKRLPLAAHLRTTWSLPPEICEEITVFVNTAVREYVSYWFSPVSPNEDFPNDAKFLLADMFGAFIARVIDMDSSQALTLIAKSIELFRLHLGWFRETYAQLSEEHPDVFAGEDSPANLQKRQEHIAALVQRSHFLHPGCVASPLPAAATVTSPSAAGKKNATDSAEVLYLRHMATQILGQLKPELASQYDTNIFVSIAMNFIRESMVFKGLKPAFEYALPRYSNEAVVSWLQSLPDDSDEYSAPMSPTVQPVSPSGQESAPTKRLHLTKSFIYKASKRAENSEATFQAVVEAAEAAAAAGAEEARLSGRRSSIGEVAPFESYDWKDAHTATFASSSSPLKKSHFGRPKVGSPRTKLSTQKVNEFGHHQLEELKHMKANIENSLNNSLHKVKRRLRNLSHDSSSNQSPATRMMKRPGKLLQKLRRNEVGIDTSIHLSPVTSVEGSVSSSVLVSDSDNVATKVTKEMVVQDRVVLLLDKTTTNYLKLYHERAEMRSSTRSRELYEFLSALEDFFMLGFRDTDEDNDTTSSQTPQGSISKEHEERESLLSPSSRSCASDGSNQYYWNYLAQDRPETPFLNAHYQFVANQCPQCCDNESFSSTRGIQWIMVAVEKGMLWEYITALYLNRRLTEQFYDEEYAILRSNKLMERVLKSLLPLSKARVMFDFPSLLGRKSDMEEEFGVSPSTTQRTVNSARVVESVWEVERYVPIHGWTKTQDKKWNELPSSEWVWETEWVLEGISDTETDPGACWEYAKTFEDRFHEKEKKFDSVRRRKWIRKRRQLPPVLISSMQSSCVSTAGIGKSKAVKRLELRDSETVGSVFDVTTRSSMTRRRSSFSFDSKSDQVEPAETVLALSDTGSGTEGRTSSFKKKRRSLASLTRSSATIIRRKGQIMTSLKGLAVIDDLLGDFNAVDDDDDDDTLCFRCLKSLATNRRSTASAFNTCQSCHQRVCAACHDFFAFLVFPPPLETSKKEQVCGSCYERLVSKYKLKIEAHVGKYLVKDRDHPDANSTISSPTGSSVLPSNTSRSRPSAGSDLDFSATCTSANASNMKYEITVQLKDDNSYGWSVIKTFHDFELLERTLYEKAKKQEKKHGAGCHACHLKGVDYMEMHSVKPCLKALPVSSMTYDKRIYVLEEFLQHMLACDTLCQSLVVQKFLLLDNANNIPGASLIAGNENTDSSLAAASGAVHIDNGKWKKGRWIAPETNSKETKMRILQKLEVSLFTVLSEVFEFDGIGMVRRHLFSMSRSFIKAFLNASHFRRLERKYLSFTDAKRMAGLLHSFRLYMFPDPTLPPPPIPPAVLSPSEMQTLRQRCLDAILESFPSPVVSIFGEASSENAALKLHEFLQHEVFMKNLLFSIADEVLLHIFPDTTTFKPKRAARREGSTSN
ncbi:TPA: hypothetical protein N0F65_010410 [Lagenidium giganteum]|uniref:PX domain-containing protein n=1 Tax=Lagenidium giganteum TaxID=4803 RepID=A0AAV2YTY0_9STRA|nr:TPA: hypothetical protein N0F65_010410 [Lagenidium giganteum]